jgi:hypothetical protein
MLDNEPAKAESDEETFPEGLSSEKHLRRNPCALRLYILILSLQDVWTNTEDNKL